MSQSNPKSTTISKSEPIAVVGVSGIFPGAERVESFWKNIVEKRDLITDVPKTYWLEDDFFDSDPKKRDKVYGKRMGSVPLVGFDYLKFGMPPSVMEHTDAGQLLGLLAAKALFETSFGDKFPDIDREKISVILGYSLCTPLTTELAGSQHKPIWIKALREAGVSDEKIEEVVRLRDSYSTNWQEASFPGCLQNVITGRIANRFDLHGTNCVVDAACASSLAALHMAIKELQSGDSDMVITGGAQTASTPMMFMCFTKTPAMSPSGECKPFDDESDGMLIGEGVGLIALRRLSDAERDGNHILALVKGLGTSSDGKGKSIYAPEPEGQVRAIRRAYEVAGYGPETVELLEAHGTGTKAGDAAEMKSSGRVFSEAAPGDKNWCALGSVKSQIGHTAGAAGAASLIKVVLALHHKILPATINVSKPTEQVDWENSPFYLNADTRPWIHSQEYPRRASISSFGFGGTNFHVTLEEYKGRAKGPRIDPWKSELVPLSAEEASGLSKRLSEIEQEIEKGFSLYRIAREARKSFKVEQGFRLSIVASDVLDLRSKLAKSREGLSKGGEQWFPPLGIYYKPGFKARKLAFLFPGQGSQYLGMCGDLAQNFDSFLDIWDKGDGQRLDGNFRLSQVVFPKSAFDASELARQKARLTETQWAQPSLGLTSAAMIQLLGRFGVKAEMAAGHSFGEVTALHYAGSFDLGQLLKIARKRGELMAGASSQKGAMLAVAGVAKTVEERLRAWKSSVVIANYNAPQQVILSGEVGEIQKVKASLEGEGFKTTLLDVSTAFHSPLVSGSKEAFYSFLKGIPIVSPKLSVFSNETANVYAADSEVIREKLASHLCNPVRFSDEVVAMHESGANIFVEVGPGSTLSKLTEECLQGKDFIAVPMDNKRQDGITALNHALARLSALGIALNLELLNGRWLPEREVAEVTSTTVSIDSSTYKKKYPLLAEVTEISKAQPKEMEEMKKQPNEVKIELQPNVVTEAAIGFERAAAVGGAPARSFMAPPPSFPRPVSTRGVEKVAPLAPVRDVEAPTPVSPALASGVSNSAEAERLTKVLLEVVAEKTGYPSEMLNLEMDMEGDLGIDSIKRVEILSAIRDREPNLPEVQAEKMAQMRSLAQVVEFMKGAGTDSTQNIQAPSGVNQSSLNSGAPSLGADVGMNAAVSFAGDAGRLTKVLLEVVAEKTGYPSEMLNLEMDMEGDLGIDSIKRVEILSAIRDREPNLPEVQAEKMAQMRTLAQIVEFMKGDATAAVIANQSKIIPLSSVSAANVSNKSEAPAPANASDGMEAERLTKVLLEVVAEKTGYPSEMLNLEMDMEGDLGIDSIKRVEILSAIRDREPNLPEVQAEKMAEMRTLAQIVDFMKGGAAGAAVLSKPSAGFQVEHIAERLFVSAPLDRKNLSAANSGDAERLTKVLLEVVAEKTGYPSEMLNLEMDMEGDLGIDSIKRVEILSAIRDREPNLPEVQAEKMAEMRTLAQIVDFMKGGGVVETLVSPSSDESPIEQISTKAISALSSESKQPATTDSGDAERLTKVLLEVVAEKTGYPSEMLNLEMDMEGDLGIDSIKRVEILSAIRDREPNLPEVQAEKMAEMRTLGQIVNFMKGSSSSAGLQKSVESPEVTKPNVLNENRPSSVGRYEVDLVPCDSRSHVALAQGKKILIVDEGAGVGEAMQKIFQVSGFQSQLVKEEEIGSPEDFGAVIYLGGLKPVTNYYAGAKINKEAFRYAQKFASAVKSAAKQGGGWFITVQDTGGGFGFEGDISAYQATRGGLSGLAKTIQHEWQGVYVKAIDLRTEHASPETLAMEIVQEIFQGGDKVEIALPLDGRRLTTAVVESSVSLQKNLPLDENSVLVVSGGARGITASCVIELAKKYRPKVVLFGRSEVPEQEEGYLAQAADLADIKRVIFQRSQAVGEKISPLELEKRARLILNAREVRVTLKALRAAGSQVKYFPCDILESRLIRTEGPSWTWKAGNLVRNALAEVRKEWGAITGLVHGAGVLADKLIEEKTSAQFDMVFDTKVSGLGELLSVLDRDPLKLIVLFSSVSARFGNAGQSDYAMGNEVMNKIAQAEKLRRGSDVCVKSINWGAWESGMVSSSLKKEFEKRGIRLIPMEEGPSIFLRELEEANSPVEVVLGSPLQSPEGSKKKVSDRLVVEVSAGTHRFLEDHSIKKVPVVPAVLAMEWFAKMATRFVPNRPLSRLKNVRVLKGIELPDFYKEGRNFELRALADSSKSDDVLKMELKGPDQRLHYACEADFSPLSEGAEVFPSFDWRGTGKRLEIETEYEAFFYGPKFKMLRNVEIIDEQTIAVEMSNTRGMKWTSSLGDGSEWTIDSAMVEGGFQSLLWLLRRLQGGIALPAKVGALDLLAPIPADETVNCLAKVKRFDKVRAVSEIYFYSSKGKPIARIRDVESYIMPA